MDCDFIGYCYNYFMKPTPRNFLTLLVLPIASMIAQDQPVSTIARMDAAAYLKPLNDQGVVALKTIAGDFNANQVAAVGKYSGQRITVVGRISDLSQGQSENKVMVVTLQDAGKTLPAVKAEFLPGCIPLDSSVQFTPDGTTANLLRRDRNGNILGEKPFLSVDQTVAIKGDYKEVNGGNIVLTACKLESKERLHELRNKLKKSSE